MLSQNFHLLTNFKKHTSQRPIKSATGANWLACSVGTFSIGLAFTSCYMQSKTIKEKTEAAAAAQQADAIKEAAAMRQAEIQLTEAIQQAEVARKIEASREAIRMRTDAIRNIAAEFTKPQKSFFHPK